MIVSQGEKMKKEQIVTAAVIFLGLSAMVFLGKWLAWYLAG